MPTFMVTAISAAYDMDNTLYRKDNCGLKWVLRRVKWKISISSLLTTENLPTTLFRNTLNNDLQFKETQKAQLLTQEEEFPSKHSSAALPKGDLILKMSFYH